MARNTRNDREARERLRLYQARQRVHETKLTRRRRDNVIALSAALVVIVLAVTAQVLTLSAPNDSIDAAPSPTPSEAPTDSPVITGDVAPPELAENRTWAGELELNDVSLSIELYGEAAPQAVAAFVQNVRSDYFAGKNCHRLTDDGFHVLQCGSVDGQGGGDPTYMFGPIENAPEDDFYETGTIAMARASGNPNSNGRQFFIVYDDTMIPSDAAGGYTVFGRVTEGLDRLRSEITDSGVVPGSAPNDGAPVVPTTITRVTID